MTAVCVKSHLWFNVDHADLPTAQDLLHRVHTGAVQVPLVLAVLNKPAGGGQRSEVSLRLSRLLRFSCWEDQREVERVKTEEKVEEEVEDE